MARAEKVKGRGSDLAFRLTAGRFLVIVIGCTGSEMEGRDDGRSSSYSPGGSWIRTFSSALDRQRFRGFVRVGSIYRRPDHPSTCRPRHTIELSRDGPRSRHSPRIRQRRRCKRIAEPNPRRSWEAVTPSRLDQQQAVLRGTESLLTLCWRGQSRANSSRK